MFELRTNECENERAIVGKMKKKIEKKCFYVTMMKENDNDDDNISILHECACFGFPRDSLSVYLPENYTKACAYVYFLLCQYYYVAYCFAKVACKKHFSYGDTREKRLHKE